MHEPNEQPVENEQPICLDRRTALASIALAVGGLSMQFALPSSALAKSRRRTRKKAAVYYYIIYQLNGGRHPMGQRGRIKRGTSLAVFKLMKPKRTAYQFAGWYTDRKLTKPARRIYGRTARSTRTLYAKWKPVRYRITYHLNGGKAVRKLPKYYTIESKRVAPYPPKRTGYKFMGWYADKGLKYRRDYIKVRSYGERAFYAKWEIVKYSIKYGLGGGTEILALPTSYTIRSPRIKPFPPIKNGYRFGGWYSDFDRTKRKSYIKAGSTGNVALYAKWIPTTYWNAHLAEKCARVNELDAENESGVPSFVFITDMHIPSNTLVSPDLVRRVLKNTGANMVVFGGDVMDRATKKSDAKAMIRFVRNAFGSVEMHFVRGNHDSNTEGTGVGKDEEISVPELMKLVACKGEVHASRTLDYYKDDKKHKVRYIFMDSGAPIGCYVSTMQLDWLKKRIMELKEGWTVLIFVHQFFGKGGYDTNGRLIKRLLDQIYSKSKAQIAAVISGHVHCDLATYSKVGSQWAYLMVSTACDAVDKTPKTIASTRKVGTITEQAFDVVTLDTKKKMLYFTRIGAGKDRAYRYAKPEEEPVVDPPVPDDPVDPVVPDEPDAGSGGAEDTGPPLQAGVSA